MIVLSLCSLSLTNLTQLYHTTVLDKQPKLDRSRTLIFRNSIVCGVRIVNIVTLICLLFHVSLQTLLIILPTDDD